MAVVGAGPAGLVAARHLLAQGFEPLVLDRGPELGGVWSEAARDRGVWAGMRANTSRAATAFSGLAPAGGPMFPSAPEVHAYLRAYATRFGVAARIATGVRVVAVAPAGRRWRVDWVGVEGGEGESALFAAVVLAGGRFSRPRFPGLPGLDGFARTGRLLHASAYRTRDELRGLRVLVHGNGSSGLEIASDLAAEDSISVVSACTRPRFVLPKVLGGVPMEAIWPARLAEVRTQALPPAREAAELRRIARELGGDPVPFGGLAPDPDIFGAGVSQCQSYLPLLAEGKIRPKPAVRRIEGDAVRFADGSAQRFDAIVFADGYDADLSYLAAEVKARLGSGAGGLSLERATAPPELPGLGLVGQLAVQGPSFPVLERQAAWLAALWSADAPPCRGDRAEGPGESRRSRWRRPHAHEVVCELAPARAAAAVSTVSPTPPIK
ncbi:MAG TPA: NAD(P)/FAD-dependent oxidoreductase [Solirubrobacterales bacterium]|nr:NAD(P)/FAD-dependent oxidoreductase [Solirubrobacterales bacterium]